MVRTGGDSIVRIRQNNRQLETHLGSPELIKRNRRKVRLLSVEGYEREARDHLTPELINYINRGTESEATLRRNVEAYSMFQLCRRVLHGIQEVETDVSYFDGAIKSELPFFPSCLNVSSMYPKALLDILRVSKNFRVPIFVSEIAVTPPLEFSRLPEFVEKGTQLIWQIYLQRGGLDRSMEQARKAKVLGYSGLTVTVDTELNVKLGNEIPKALVSQEFIAVTPDWIRKLRSKTSLPLIVKGVMSIEDAKLAIESGADGVVVSNHGGRTLDHGQATIEVLPAIARELKSNRSTRKAEIFLDGGIRRGTDILKALALGSSGCLLGRAIFWGLAVNRKSGVNEVMQILKSELIRAAALCGVKKLSGVDPKTVVGPSSSGTF